MIMPIGGSTFREGLHRGRGLHSLKKVLHDKASTAVGDEGGSPNIASAQRRS